MSLLDTLKNAKSAADLDVVGTVREFLTVLRSIDTKLDTLTAEMQEMNRNATLDRLGRTTRERMAFDRTMPAPDADCGLGCPTDATDDDLDLDAIRARLAGDAEMAREDRR